MQRRAAAAYFALFLVISAGAYAFTGVAEKPHVEIDASQHTYEPGDELSADGRTYTVNAVAEVTTGGGGHGGGGGASIVGNLTWTDPSATYTASLGNNTTVDWQTVSWDGQDLQRITLDAGETVQYNGSSHEVVLNESASPPTMRLQQLANTSINDSYAVGDSLSLTYEDELILSATLTSVTGGEATLTWSDDYRVVIPNTSDPDTVTMVQEFNVTRRLMSDPLVFNETTVVDGVRSVAYRNDTYQRLDEYLPEPTVHEISEGETLAYDGNETTVGNITTESVPLSWTGSRTYLVELAEGSPLTLNDQPYFVHFPSNESVQILPNGSNSQFWASYQTDQTRIDSYNERMSGLWGVSILSMIAAFIIAIAAYVPVKD